MRVFYENELKVNDFSIYISYPAVWKYSDGYHSLQVVIFCREIFYFLLLSDGYRVL